MKTFVTLFEGGTGGIAVSSILFAATVVGLASTSIALNYSLADPNGYARSVVNVIAIILLILAVLYSFLKLISAIQNFSLAKTLAAAKERAEKQRALRQEGKY